MNRFLLSSTGEGIKLRILSLIPLVVPVINGLGANYGVQILSDDLTTLVDAVAVIFATMLHIYGWIRSFKK